MKSWIHSNFAQTNILGNKLQSPAFVCSFFLPRPLPQYLLAGKSAFFASRDCIYSLHSSISFQNRNLHTRKFLHFFAFTKKEEIIKRNGSFSLVRHLQSNRIKIHVTNATSHDLQTAHFYRNYIYLSPHAVNKSPTENSRWFEQRCDKILLRGL